jgi:hypothetical protein
MSAGRLGHAAALVAITLALVACGETTGASTLRSTALVDRAQRPPLVNGLHVDPQDGSFLLTTNRGYFRVRADGRGYRKLRSTVAAAGSTASVGTFLEVLPLGDGVLLGSGHPDDRRSQLPQFLGVMRSADRGRTWKIIAREGMADLHVMRQAGRRVYGFDAVLGAMLVSDDGGRTWAEHAAPRGQLMADFVVDPADASYLLASTEDSLYRSADSGRTWRPLAPARTARLAWPTAGRVLRADKSGTVYESGDRGDSWTRIGDVGSEVWKLAAVDERTLYAAIGDGSIRGSRDGGRTWSVIFTP